MKTLPLAPQRGVVLIFTLIVLLIMTIGAVALLHSMNSSLFSAGNLAFHRDLVNQGEQAVSTVLQSFQPGGALANATANSSTALNYSATALPTNAQGVPTALLGSDATFGAVGLVANDLTGAGGVTMRYVVDRLCSNTGASSSTSCTQYIAKPPGGNAPVTSGLPPPTATVYRLSVRVNGPRSTQLFLQTTFSKPD
jgi:type IV pilus assembly protein PilX